MLTQDAPVANVPYHDRPEISRSMLATFAESPRLYEAMYVTKTVSRIEETDAMIIGTLTHQQLLEPHAENLITIIPDDVLASNGARIGKKWKEFEAANSHRTLLKKEDYEVSMMAISSVKKAIGKWIDHKRSQREREIYWTDVATGLEMRAKIDLITDGREALYVIDIKTCADLDRFENQIRDGLWLQYAHYREAVGMEFAIDPIFFFCVVEKSGCYRVRNFTLDEATAAVAYDQYVALKHDLARRYATGDWSEKGEGVISPLNITLKALNHVDNNN